MQAVKANGTQEDLVRPLLIPDVSKTLPKGIRLQMWERKEEGKEIWCIKESIDYINTEIIAQEKYEYLKREQEPVKSNQRLTGSALYVSTEVKKCVFCDINGH